MAQVGPPAGLPAGHGGARRAGDGRQGGVRLLLTLLLWPERSRSLHVSVAGTELMSTKQAELPFFLNRAVISAGNRTPPGMTSPLFETKHCHCLVTWGMKRAWQHDVTECITMRQNVHIGCSINRASKVTNGLLKNLFSIMGKKDRSQIRAVQTHHPGNQPSTNH